MSKSAFIFFGTVKRIVNVSLDRFTFDYEQGTHQSGFTAVEQQNPSDIGLFGHSIGAIHHEHCEPFQQFADLMHFLVQASAHVQHNVACGVCVCVWEGRGMD
jgi:hypothetical protein